MSVTGDYGTVPSYQVEHSAGAGDAMVGDNEEAPVLTGFEDFAGDTVKVGIEVFDADDWELHSISIDKQGLYSRNK